MHYWAGGQVQSPPYAFNGADASIYITNPTVPDHYVGAWIGMFTYATGGVAILVQDGLLKVNGGVSETFYQLCASNSKNCYWTGGNQSLTVGDYYDFNVTYDGGYAHYQFAGVNKYNIQLSAYGITGVTDSNTWYPEAQGEVASYSDQMPGVSTNEESFNGLESRRWAGSGTTWDSSTDQGWSVSGYPNGASGGVSQSRINASFKNSYNPLGPLIDVYDACTTS